MKDFSPKVWRSWTVGAGTLGPLASYRCWLGLITVTIYGHVNTEDIPFVGSPVMFCCGHVLVT
jgi:hypothetical protein